MWQVVSGITEPPRALTMGAGPGADGEGGSRRDLLTEEGGEPVEQQAGTVLALRGVLEVVEERAVFGEDEPRAGAVGSHLDGRQRHGDEPPVEQEVVCEDD